MTTPDDCSSPTVQQPLFTDAIMPKKKMLLEMFAILQLSTVGWFDRQIARQHSVRSRSIVFFPMEIVFYFDLICFCRCWIWLVLFRIAIAWNNIGIMFLPSFSFFVSVFL